MSAIFMVQDLIRDVQIGGLVMTGIREHLPGARRASMLLSLLVAALLVPAR
jgi:hypothetical protein